MSKFSAAAATVEDGIAQSLRIESQEGGRRIAALELERRESRSAHAAMEDLQRAHGALEREHQSALQELSEHRTGHAELSQRYEELAAAHDQLQRSIDEAKSTFKESYEHVRIERDALSAKLATLEHVPSELEELKRQHQALLTEHKDLQQDQSDMRQRNESLLAQQKVQAQDSAAFQRKYDQLIGEVEACKRESAVQQELNSKYSELLAEFEALRKQGSAQTQSQQDAPGAEEAVPPVKKSVQGLSHAARSPAPAAPCTPVAETRDCQPLDASVQPRTTSRGMEPMVSERTEKLLKAMSSGGRQVATPVSTRKVAETPETKNRRVSLAELLQADEERLTAE